MSGYLQKEITVTLTNGKQVTSDVRIYYSTESNYGADADGNRGMEATFIDEVDCGDVEVADDGSALSTEEKNEAYARFEDKIEGYI